MPRKPLPQTDEGFEKEIKFLRRLIKEIQTKLTAQTGLAELLEMLEKVGKAAPQLARMVKAQHDLAAGELDQASLLRQALDELREEWPEFRDYCAEFEPASEELHEP
ncbi:MAG: hypothetical protein ABFD24_09610 [Anaerolineaceae bacterium]